MRRLPLRLLLLASVAGAAGAAPLPREVFAADTAPGYRPVPQALSAYLDERAARAGAHRFCVVGYRLADSGRVAWVYWQDGQRLIHWEPAADGFESKETLTHARRDLDLRRDVVATERELAGSSYRIDRAWLQRLLADCRQHGQRFVIRRP